MIIIIFPLSILLGIISYLVTEGYLRKEEIEVKFCYFDITENCLDTSQISQNGLFVIKKSEFKSLQLFYQLLNSCKIDSAFNELYNIKPGNYYEIPFGLPIEILKYCEDSSMVKIRAKIRKPTVGYEVEQNGFIPSLLLHDSI